MASAAIIDIDSILAPISVESPGGVDIREDYSPTSVYQAIKGSRNAARAAERNNMFDSDSSEADISWRNILEQAPDILQHHSKDLEIACWYTEALIRRYGFQGLRDGFTIICGLVEQYWDNLYPMPDEDGIETRVASLSGLNGEGAEGVLIVPIRNVPITQGDHPGPFTVWQYQQAREIQRLQDDEARRAKTAQLGFEQSDIERAVTESTEQFFIDQRDDLSRCIELFRKTSKLLDEYCDTHEAPPTSNIINTLENTLGAVNHLGKDKLPTAEQDLPADNENDISTESASSPKALTAGAIRDRQAAFKQLNDIADFFRKTEPHSPISYVLQKAVKWGNMPLNELIAELIPDQGSREHFGTLTGVSTSTDDNE